MDFCQYLWLKSLSPHDGSGVLRQPKARAGPAAVRDLLRSDPPRSHTFTWNDRNVFPDTWPRILAMEGFRFQWPFLTFCFRWFSCNVLDSSFHQSWQFLTVFSPSDFASSRFVSHSIQLFKHRLVDVNSLGKGDGQGLSFPNVMMVVCKNASGPAVGLLRKG
ncbi:hypothetical protein NL676_022335 [Syzygium grande]|nr:hypothetical protein NL676_022335 [Syzygium grande]